MSETTVARRQFLGGVALNTIARSPKLLAESERANSRIRKLRDREVSVGELARSAKFARSREPTATTLSAQDAQNLLAVSPVPGRGPGSAGYTEVSVRERDCLVFHFDNRSVARFQSLFLFSRNASHLNLS